MSSKSFHLHLVSEKHPRFLVELPVLPSPPIIVKVNETHLELEFPSWEASLGSGDRPSSYVVEIRRAGAEDWDELKRLSALESGMIFVTIKHNFQVTAAYEVRVLPILTHEGTDYQGHGVPTTFTVIALTVQGELYISDPFNNPYILIGSGAAFQIYYFHPCLCFVHKSKQTINDHRNLHLPADTLVTLNIFTNETCVDKGLTFS